MKVIWDSKRNWTIIFLLMIIGLMVVAQRATRADDMAETEPKITYLDLEDIRLRGVLRAITGNNSLSYFVYKGRPMGYEFELLQNYADYLEVELEIIVASDLEEMFELLNEGKGDIIADNLTVTSDRMKLGTFTDHYNIVKQVLIQRKPEKWWRYTRDQIDAQLVRNPIDLMDKEVVVRENSSYEMRLNNLSNEIGGEIRLEYATNGLSTDELIQDVSNGKIDYTVADNNIALMNATYFKNIDIETDISFPQRVAWAVRHNAPDLLENINEWVGKVSKNGQYLNIYNKYFMNSRAFSIRLSSDYYSATGGNISIYDEEIKKIAAYLKWDWRLLAAQIYKESKFKE